MENLLHGIPCIIVRVDDILVRGKDDVDHLSNLDVLTTLSAAGLRLKKRKCEFMVAQVTYCGYRISGSGVEPVKDKVEAIQKAPQPQNVSQLRSFLGMLNYYHQFLPNIARAETKALIGGGGGGAYSYIRVLPDEFLLKSTVMTTDFKRNSLGRTRIYEYTPPPN